MDARRWPRAQALFDQAVSLPDTERAAFLEREAGDDPELVAFVTALLAEDARSDSLLDQDLSHVAAEVLDGSVPIVRKVGPYRIVDVLGQGGMGVVYLAERDDLGSRVAIKVLRDASLSPARRERFQREQQTLAQLNHPGIARLYDADVLPDGTPYFVMEYVAGVPLTTHCREQACATAERLRLFREVCEAVQYAHRRAVIHRDLKPSNILVAKGGEDGEPAVRLLDFGIAKQLESVDTSVEQTHTHFRLLTPAHAAPEQIRGDPVGVYTDVYALGVILYQLLTGEPPFELTGLTPAEVEARVLGGAPTRPSHRVFGGGTERRRTDAPGTGARPADATALGRTAWADLDVLCLTAMHEDPQRRYATVEALVRDLDHFRHGEPLEARPDSVRYRTAKFVRRNRRQVAAAGTACIALLAAGAFHTARLRTERDVAEAAAARAEAVSDYLISLFEAGDPFGAGTDSLDLRMLLDRGVERVEELAGQPTLQAQMLDVLGRVHTQLGEYEPAGELLHRALAMRETGGDPLDAAATLAHLGRLHGFTGRRDSAEIALREALRVREAHLPPRDPAIAVNLNDLGSLLTEQGRYDQADSLYRRAIEILRQVHDGPHRDLSETLGNLGVNYFNRGDHAAAEPYYREALDIDRAVFGREHPNVATRMANLAGVLEARGDFVGADTTFTEALRILRARLGADHYLAAFYQIQLGSMLRRAGSLQRAERELREAVAVHERQLGPDHPNTIVAVNQLALTLSERGDHAAAEPLLRRAASGFRASLGEQHYYSGSSLCQLAHALHMIGRPQEAEPLFREGLAVVETVLPPDHASLVLTRSRFGALLVTLSRYEEAEPLLLDAYEVLVRARGADHEQTRETADAIVRLYEAQGRADRADPYRVVADGK